MKKINWIPINNALLTKLGATTIKPDAHTSHTKRPQHAGGGLSTVTPQTPLGRINLNDVPSFNGGCCITGLYEA